jgi:hypothetical protein
MNLELGDDLLIGAKSIGAWMKLPARQIFYMAETGTLPLFKIGGKWAGRKSTISTHIANLESSSPKSGD